MDNALSTDRGGETNNNHRNDRRNYSSSGYQRGGGGGGRNNYRGGYRGGDGNRGGRGGRYNNNHRPYHQRGGGGDDTGRGGRGGGWGGGSTSHHHHNSNQSTVPQGNRFVADQTQNSHRRDPKQRVLQDLLQMVNKIGEIPKPQSVANDDENVSVSDNTQQRDVVRIQASNIQGLTGVVCSPSNIDLFLQHEDNNNNQNQSIGITAEKYYGPMVASVVHCQSVWPIQTACYATLTLSIDCYSKVSNVAQNSSTFAERCVDYATLILSRDLDLLFLDSKSAISSLASKSDPLVDFTRTLTRVRLTLRYLCMLTSFNIIQKKDSDANEDLETMIEAVTIGEPTTMIGFMTIFARAAVVCAQSNDNKNSGFILASLIWSMIPYLTSIESKTWLVETLVNPLEEVLVSSYQSSYSPGVGSKAILLKEEQLEDIQAPGEDDDDDDDEDEDDDELDDDDDAAGQVCDSLQDLLRAVKHFLNMDEITDNAIPVRFSLFTDTPWKEVQGPAMPSNVSASLKKEGGDNDIPENDDPDAMGVEADVNIETVTEKASLTYTDHPLKLNIFAMCKSLILLLGIDQPMNNNETENSIKIAKTNLHGAVYGRLPIFGPPPELQDEDDEIDDTSKKTSNERLNLYQKTFGLVDRYFISESIRDILLCHESSVTDAGIEHGSVKFVAEQILSLNLMLKGNKNEGHDSSGIEYIIIETLVTLIVQNTRDSPMSIVFLSRIVLELVRLQPQIMSPVIAIAVSILFKDYMPTIVPKGRCNLSTFLSFHLINTDYQWPASYWKIYEPFVLFGWKNSRGAFVKGTLSLIVESLSNPESLISDCLPKGSGLGNHLIEKAGRSDSLKVEVLDQLTTDIRTRMYANEDEGMILGYLTSDDVSESTLAAMTDRQDVLHPIDPKARSWWRLFVVASALFAPAKQEYERIKNVVEIAINTESSDMEEEKTENAMTDANHDDVLTLIKDAISRYKSLISGVISKDANTIDDSSETLSGAELFILEQLEVNTVYSRSTLEGCLHSLIFHKCIRIDNVLKWLLNDVNGTVDGKDTRVYLRWWEIATSSIQFCVYQIMIKAPEVSEAMSIDDGVDSSSLTTQKAKKVIEFLEPALSYVIRRVCNILTSLPSPDGKGTKLTPTQVDLVEGVKYVIVDSYSIFLTSLQDSHTSQSDLKVILAESSIAAAKLLTSIRNDSRVESPAVDILRRTIQRL